MDLLIKIQDWVVLDNTNATLVLGCAITCLLFRQWRSLLFCIFLFIFYAFTIYLDSWIQADDPARVWRYIKWVGVDIAFLSCLYFFVRKSLIEAHYFYISCGIEFFAVSMMLFRMIDWQLTGATLTESIYYPVIYMTNVCYALLACYAAFNNIVRRLAWD